MDAQSVFRAIAAGADRVWVVRCSSDVLAPELAADDLAVGVLVEYRGDSAVPGYRESANEDGSRQVGEVGDGNWSQGAVASHPSLVGSVLLHTNGGVR